ncbi:MAG: hypothetical protein HUJ27_08925 [Rhodobacteraceae bacterium]|nr:hypothetical protein [Paracoccaceae bacterium]
MRRFGYSILLVTFALGASAEAATVFLEAPRDENGPLPGKTIQRPPPPVVECDAATTECPNSEFLDEEDLEGDDWEDDGFDDDADDEDDGGDDF